MSEENITRLVLDLSDEEVQLITYLLNKFAINTKNMNEEDKLELSKLGIEKTQEILDKEFQLIKNTSKKIMDAYTNGTTIVLRGVEVKNEN